VIGPCLGAARVAVVRCGGRRPRLHAERGQLESQLIALDKATPQAADPNRLDQLPLAGDVLPGLTPRLKARLFAAFGLEVLWNKTDRQATVFVKITEATLQAVPGSLDHGQDGYHDNAEPVPAGDLFDTPIGGLTTSRIDTVSPPRRLVIEATYPL
jgi:hypothetical protein